MEEKGAALTHRQMGGGCAPPPYRRPFVALRSPVVARGVRSWPRDAGSAAQPAEASAPARARVLAYDATGGSSAVAAQLQLGWRARRACRGGGTGRGGAAAPPAGVCRSSATGQQSQSHPPHGPAHPQALPPLHRMYCLACIVERTWRFGLPLVLATIPGGWQAIALLGFASPLASSLLVPAVGQALDRTYRCGSRRGSRGMGLVLGEWGEAGWPRAEPGCPVCRAPPIVAVAASAAAARTCVACQLYTCAVDLRCPGRPAPPRPARRPYGLGALVACQDLSILASGLVLIAAAARSAAAPLVESPLFALLVLLSMVRWGRCVLGLRSGPAWGCPALPSGLMLRARLRA